MLRDLPHIASLAFNQPLLLEPAYARVFFCALGRQLGARQMTDAGGQIFTGPEGMNVPLAAYGDGDRAERERNYQVQGRIAIIPVVGTLVNKGSWLGAMSGMTGYNAIISQIQQAISDPGVDGLLLDMDTPGGMVAGAFDCSDTIARLRQEKPIWALANDMNCSAGQLLASACSHRLVTQTAATGSIGVITAHSSYEKQLETEGIDITLIYSGAHKADGNSVEKLPAAVRDQMQTASDALRQMFCEKVSLYTGMSVQALLDTEAAVFRGQSAVDAGLADELVLNTDAIAHMREAINAKTQITSTVNKGVSMKTENTTTQSAAADLPDGADLALKTAGETGAAVELAVSAERTRIMGILGCEEAKGREDQAQVLAGIASMNVEDAKKILSASPVAVQARSETALDVLMKDSPGAVEAAQTSAETDSDLKLLMSIPL